MKIKACTTMTMALMMMAGCGSTVETSWDTAEDVPPPVEISEALINGTQTLERAEIGRTIIGGSSCTGTLISDRVMVSARHCLKYTTCEDRACVQGWGGGVAIFEAGDGVLQDARKKIHPFRMDFDLDGFVLPIDGAARLLGVEIDGALIVQSMAFQPQLPIAELMPDLASTATP